MKDKIMFRVYPKCEAYANEAKIFESLLNTPKFREAILREFNERAQELARRVVANSIGISEDLTWP